MDIISIDQDVKYILEHYDWPDNVRELGAAMARPGRVLNVLIDVEVGGRRTGGDRHTPRAAH